MSRWNIWQQCGKSHNTPSLMNITVSGFLFKFIMTWIFTITKQKVKCYSGKKECGLVKRDTLTELSLTHKIPIWHPPDSRYIHFPLIVFNYSLPLETAVSHSSSWAAMALEETPNQNICLSFSLHSDRWMSADTRGRCICTNQSLISVSPSSKCFILTGHNLLLSLDLEERLATVKVSR